MISTAGREVLVGVGSGGNCKAATWSCLGHKWDLPKLCQAALLPAQLSGVCPALLCFRCLGCAQEHVKHAWHMQSLPQNAVFRMPNFLDTFVARFIRKCMEQIFPENVKTLCLDILQMKWLGFLST